jgi:hypothetical protein
MHMAQGLTISKLAVNVGRRVFEDGQVCILTGSTITLHQAYVALSRGESLSGLLILEMASERFTVDPMVVSFYRTLAELERRKTKKTIQDHETKLQ